MYQSSSQYHVAFIFQRPPGNAEDEGNTFSQNIESRLPRYSVIYHETGILNYSTVKTSNLNIFIQGGSIQTVQKINI